MKAAAAKIRKAANASAFENWNPDAHFPQSQHYPSSGVKLQTSGAIWGRARQCAAAISRPDLASADSRSCPNLNLPARLLAGQTPKTAQNGVWPMKYFRLFPLTYVSRW